MKLIRQGKVRDIYELNDELLMLTATDRLSAFDVIFNEKIPDKGKILTKLSLFWANKLKAAQPFHHVLLSRDDRSCVVEKLDMIPIECVIRGYLVGSGWKDYQATGSICGHKLPKGMNFGDGLPEVLFTPAIKAELGDHDENISFNKAVELVGAETMIQLKERSIRLFTEARQHAFDCGLRLIDTKFEFGRRKDGTIVLADEILTPDSSRYCDLQQCRETERGKMPPSFDKQVVRDYLETLDWDKAPPPPTLPTDIVNKLRDRYMELYTRLTGLTL